MSAGLRRTAAFALLAMTVPPTPAAAQTGGFVGHWANPRQTMVVNVSRCGEDYCAIVVTASEKVQANARKGGTVHFIGTEILRVRPNGNGVLRGSAFDPETNLHVAATVTVLGPNEMEIKGCAFLGLICENQRWTKVD